MSKETEAHYRQSNSCPTCGGHVVEELHGTITWYYCKDWCGWELDWDAGREYRKLQSSLEEDESYD